MKLYKKVLKETAQEKNFFKRILLIEEYLLKNHKEDFTFPKLDMELMNYKANYGNERMAFFALVETVCYGVELNIENSKYR